MPGFQDPAISDLFFQVPETKDRPEDQVDFPLPPDDKTFPTFLTSKAGNDYREGVRELIRLLRDWMTRHDMTHTSPLDHFIKKYVEYTGSDRGENIIMLPLLQEGIPLLKKILNLLEQYPLTLSRGGKPLPHKMITNTLYLFLDNEGLAYTVKRRKLGVSTHRLDRATSGEAIDEEIRDVIADPTTELDESHLRAIYKIAEQNGHYRPPTEKQLEKQKDQVRNMVTSMAVCAPGCHTNLYDAYLALSRNLSLELMDFRFKVVRNHIQEAMRPYEDKIDPGNHIHFVNAILKPQAKTLGLLCIKDTFEHVCNQTTLRGIQRKLLRDLRARLATKPHYKENLQHEIQQIHLQLAAQTDKPSMNIHLMDDLLTTRLLRAQFTLDAITQYMKDTCDLPYLQQRLNSNSCQIEVIEDKPDRDVLRNRYKGKYLLIDPILTDPLLYHVDYNAQLVPVPLADVKRFRDGIAPHLDKNPHQFRLSGTEAEALITANGGHAIVRQRHLANDAIGEFQDAVEHFGEDPLYDPGQILDSDELMQERYTPCPDAEANLTLSLVHRLHQSQFLQLHYTPLPPSDGKEEETVYTLDGYGPQYLYVIVPSLYHPSGHMRLPGMTFYWESQADMRVKKLGSVLVPQIYPHFLRLFQFAEHDAERLHTLAAQLMVFLQRYRGFLADGFIAYFIRKFPESYHMPLLTNVLTEMSAFTLDGNLALARYVLFYRPDLIIDVIQKYSQKTRRDLVRLATRGNPLDSILFKLIILSPSAYQVCIADLNPDDVAKALLAIWQQAFNYASLLNGPERALIKTLVTVSPKQVIHDFLAASPPDSRPLADMISILKPDAISVLLTKMDPNIITAALFEEKQDQIKPEIQAALIQAERSEGKMDDDGETIDSNPKLDLIMRLALAYPEAEREAVFQRLLASHDITDPLSQIRNGEEAVRYVQLVKTDERYGAVMYLIQHLPVCGSDILDMSQFLHYVDIPILNNSLNLKERFLAAATLDEFNDEKSWLSWQFLERTDDNPKVARAAFLYCYGFPWALPDLQSLGPDFTTLLLIYHMTQIAIPREYESKIRKHIGLLLSECTHDKASPGDWILSNVLSQGGSGMIQTMGIENFRAYLHLTSRLQSELDTLLQNNRDRIILLFIALPEDYIQAIANELTPPGWAHFVNTCFNSIDKTTPQKVGLFIAKLLLFSTPDAASKHIHLMMSATAVMDRPLLYEMLLHTPASLFQAVLRQIGIANIQLFLTSGYDRVFNQGYLSEERHKEQFKPRRFCFQNIRALFRVLSPDMMDGFAKNLLSKYHLGPHQGLPNMALLHCTLERISPEALEEALSLEVMVELANHLSAALWQRTATKCRAGKLPALLASALMPEPVIQLTADGFSNLLSVAGQPIKDYLANPDNHYPDRLHTHVVSQHPEHQQPYLKNHLSLPYLQALKQHLDPDIFDNLMAHTLMQRAHSYYLQVASTKAIVKAYREGNIATTTWLTSLVKTSDNESSYHERAELCSEKYDSTLINLTLVYDHFLMLKYALLHSAKAAQQIIAKASPDVLMQGINELSFFFIVDSADAPSLRLLLNKVPTVPLHNCLFNHKDLLIRMALNPERQANVQIIKERMPFFVADFLKLQDDQTFFMQKPFEAINDPFKKSSYLAFLQRVIPDDFSLIYGHRRWIQHLGFAISSCKNKPSADSDILYLLLWRVHASYALAPNNSNSQSNILSAYEDGIRHITTPSRFTSHDCMLISDFLWLNPVAPNHRSLAMDYLHIAAEKGEPAAIAKLHAQTGSKAESKDDIDESQYRLTLLGVKIDTALAQGANTIDKYLEHIRKHVIPQPVTTFLFTKPLMPTLKALHEQLAQVADDCKQARWAAACSQLTKIIIRSELSSLPLVKPHLRTLEKAILAQIKLTEHVAELAARPASAEDVLVDTLSVHLTQAHFALQAFILSPEISSKNKLYASAFLQYFEAADSMLEKKLIVFALLTDTSQSETHKVIASYMDYNHPGVAIHEFEKSLRETLMERNLNLNDIIDQVVKPFQQSLANATMSVNLHEAIQHALAPAASRPSPK